MRKIAAFIFLALCIACIFGAAEAYQMEQELSLEALRLEWDLVNLDWVEYKSAIHKPGAPSRGMQSADTE